MNNNPINNTIPADIHNGAVTHHQDQVITLHNFNTKNIRNNTTGNEPISIFIILLPPKCTS